MQGLSELKPLFAQFNLPDPERFTLKAVESKLEELSGAIEDIETQLEERSEPLEWMTEEEFYEWRTKAHGAKYVKSKQAEALEMLAERMKRDNSAGVKPRPQVSHPLAEEVKRRETPAYNFEPVRYFTPSNPEGIENLNKGKKKTAERVKVDATPAKMVTQDEPLSEKKLKQELTQAVTHLKKCLRLMEKMIKDEEIALFIEEVKIIKNAREYLDRTG